MPVAGEGQLVISITDEVKDLQAQMQKMFLKQKEKGGIIDLEVIFESQNCKSSVSYRDRLLNIIP